MSHVYEIEIKSLLGSKDRADELKEKLAKKDASLQSRGTHKQLNHYFNVSEDLSLLVKNLSPVMPKEKQDALKHILEEGKNFSIRTRDADGKVLFVVKASIGDDTSANGISRMELESEVSKTLDELDAILLSSGLTYQAKWSREREEFVSRDTNITIDKNAGYGYVAEFERVLADEKRAASTKDELLSFMNELGAAELPQDRLERMFAHYNKHWQEYYGTDKIFVIE